MVYGNDYLYTYYKDASLRLFENSDSISNEILFNGELPEDFHDTFKQLAADGMVEMGKYGVKITLKGKQKVKSGGYAYDSLIRRISFAAIIVGCLASIAGIVIAVLK